jgi:hypothetical protein
MRGNISKAAQKTLERVAISAYAYHLLRGLSNDTYGVVEAKRYLAYALEDAGGHCPDYVRQDDNIFGLYENYKYNVESLQERIAYLEKGGKQ